MEFVEGNTVGIDLGTSYSAFARLDEIIASGGDFPVTNDLAVSMCKSRNRVRKTRVKILVPGILLVLQRRLIVVR